MAQHAIFLNGPIGTAKTTLGRALADRLFGGFIDDFSDPDRAYNCSILQRSRSIIQNSMTVLATRNAGVIAYPLNPNDHGPAHVHVLGPGWVVVANLIGMERELAQHLIGNLFVGADDFADTHEVDACGLGIHVPALDADLYVPALLEGVLGSERWIAARMGAKGGRARGAAKAAAVRENGRKGGRPRKAGAG